MLFFLIIFESSFLFVFTSELEDLLSLVSRCSVSELVSTSELDDPLSLVSRCSVSELRRSSRLDDQLEKDEDHEKRKTSRMNLSIATQIKTPKIQSVESPRRSTRLDAQLENVEKGKDLCGLRFSSVVAS
jgi:hypothetical protein